MDFLSLFLESAGPDLELLDLPILNDQSSIIDLNDLPSIVQLVRQYCPRLTTVKLPFNCVNSQGRKIKDRDISPPPLGITFDSGKLDSFGLYLYGTDIDPLFRDEDYQDTSLDELFSFNASQNIACIARSNSTISFYTGEDLISCIPCHNAEMKWGISLRIIRKAIAWYQR
jgi:hypothetical protein